MKITAAMRGASASPACPGHRRAPCSRTAEPRVRGRPPVSAGSGGLSSSMNGGEKRLPLRGQGSKVRFSVFFLMSSRRKRGRRRRNKVCGNGHCFPECLPPCVCVCVVEASRGWRYSFVHQKFLNVLTGNWIWECGRKQNLNSVSMRYVFHARRASPAWFYSLWRWEDGLKDL